MPYKSLQKKQAFEMMSLTWEKDLPCKRVGVPPHFGKGGEAYAGAPGALYSYILHKNLFFKADMVSLYLLFAA